MAKLSWPFPRSAPNTKRAHFFTASHACSCNRVCVCVCNLGVVPLLHQYFLSTTSLFFEWQRSLPLSYTGMWFSDWELLNGGGPTFAYSEASPPQLCLNS